MENKRDVDENILRRSQSVEFETTNTEEERKLSFPFSSEFGVMRYFGNEVLEHTERSVDLSRLQNEAPLLWNHDPDKVLGVVRGAKIGKDKRAYADVEFSRNEFASQVWDDIERGILRNVSVGYQINELEQRGDDFVATSWMPYEVSIVSIPSDFANVGVGRSLKEVVTVAQEQPNIVEDRSNDSIASSDALSTSTPVQMTTTPKETMEVRSEVDTQKVIKEERSRIQEIQTVGAKYGLQDLADKYIKEERSIAEFNSAVLREWKPEAIQQNTGEIGMTEKETGTFSFLRALNYLANPTDARAREAASFEIEASEAASAKLGRASRGITIPQDVLVRDLQTSPGSAGGDVIREELLTGSFIDLLRNESACARAGATVLSGLEGMIKIPKQSGAASATWIAEGAAAAESDQTLTQVSLVPRTVGAYTDVTRKLLLQSSIDIENFVRADLARVIALKIDLAGLYGSGVANEPLGIKNTVGIGAEAFAGAVPTFPEVIAMESDLGTANALLGSPCYITNASMRGSLKGTKKDSGSGEFVWTGGQDGEMNGYRAFVSNQVSAGDVWFGNFSDLLMGFWSGLDLTVDPYTNSTSGTVRIVALQDCDVAVRHAESFCLGT